MTACTAVAGSPPRALKQSLYMQDIRDRKRGEQGKKPKLEAKTV